MAEETIQNTRLETMLRIAVIHKKTDAVSIRFFVLHSERII